MHSEKKQLLIITSEFPPQPGGIGNHAYQLALELSKNDYLVTVIADQRSLKGHEEFDFDEKLPFEVMRIKRYQPRIIMYLKRIVTTYKNLSNVSYVIATGKFSLWNVALLSRFKKIKTLAVVHGTEVNFKSFLLRKSIALALKRMDGIVAVSNYTKSLITHLQKDVTVIPNGIRVSEWNPKVNSNMKLKGNPALTTVGRVSSRKGQLNVIKQLPELIKQFPELHYHCVGIPTEADAFLENAKTLNVDSYVTFHGSVTDVQLKHFLDATDIFVMLSTESVTGDVEGFGIAILEANAMGVPAIGSKGCGIEDAIKPHHSGILIDANDSEQFIVGITEIVNSTPKFRSEALSWAQIHDWDAIVKQYLALLQ